MKRLTLLIPILAAFALVGCNVGQDGNDFTHTWPVLVKVTETITTADQTTTTNVTEISYDQDGEASGEVTTQNGQPYRELKDYKRWVNDNGHLMQACKRLLLNENEQFVTDSLVSTYGDSYNQTWLETLFEVYTTTTPRTLVEKREVEYNDNRYQRYESETADGGAVIRDNFSYSTASMPIMTYTEIVRKDGATTSTTRMGRKSISWDSDHYLPNEYELYKDIPESGMWDGQSGLKIEERIDYEIKNMETSWTVVKYDDNGEVVSTTRVKNEFRNITISSSY